MFGTFLYDGDDEGTCKSGGYWLQFEIKQWKPPGEYTYLSCEILNSLWGLLSKSWFAL